MHRHTQVGYVTMGSVVAVILLSAALAARTPRLALLAVASVLLVIGVLFSSLTVEVDNDEIRSHFGPGFSRNRVRLADVAAVAVTRSRWWEGWGIRATPQGMLYNVSGTAAVEVQLRSGSRFRLGTDEPEALARAIRAAAGPPTA